MTKLCPRGKAAAKRKFKVYPSAYANAYASKICAGKIKDPSGVKRKEGIKASKDIKKMVDTGQADRVGGSVYHRGIREKKFMGGIIDKFKKKQKAKPPVTKIKDTVKTAKPDNKGQKLTPEQSEKVKRGIKGIKEKIAPKKKMDRLEELRKELK